jgi:alpha-L-fucosidase 2
MNVPTQYAALATARRFDILSTWTWWVNDAMRRGTLQTNTIFPNGTGLAGSIGFGAIFSFDLESPMTIAAGQQFGNPTWLALPLYQHAAFTANASMMAGLVFPYLRGCVNVYLAFAERNASDGLLHLPPSASPEYPYPDGKPGPDAHYDLALFQWGLRTLLALNSSDPLAPTWRDALATLAPFPVNEHGYMVDAAHGFDVSHRHFSHLFAIYPLHLNAWADADGGSPASRALLLQSLDRWTGLTCTGGAGHDLCPNGFTFDGAASISALVPARAAAAAGNISGFVASGLMHAATLYGEGRQPCMESPVAAAASLQEMLLQSWGGRVRVFPGAPWPEAVFHRLGAEGGLAVSAVLRGGAAAWVGLEAVDYVGGGGGGARSVVLTAPGLGPASAVGTVPAGVAVADAAGGALAFDVPVGALVLLFPLGAQPPAFEVAALPGNSSQFNYWGKH